MTCSRFRTLPKAAPAAGGMLSSACIAAREIALAACILFGSQSVGAESLPTDDILRTWVQDFESSPRGPFEGIRWFCGDGTVHPAKPYPCTERGGGIQHGLHNQRARMLRDAGFRVANILAEVGPADFLGPEAALEELGQVLVERFLVNWRGGWVMRAAGSYRGALQAEDEEAGALRLVLGLLASDEWHQPNRYLLLREAVRLLPVREDQAAAANARAEAAQIAEADARFTSLRAKIHGSPDPEDAGRVRNYLKQNPDLSPEFRKRIERLAESLDQVFTRALPVQKLRTLVPVLGDKTGVEAALTAVVGDAPLVDQIAAGAWLLETLRRSLPEPTNPEAALEALRASLAVEAVVFAKGQEWISSHPSTKRAQNLDTLLDLARALYGTGLLSSRQLAGLVWSRGNLAEEPLSVATYREELAYFARTAEWSSRAVTFALRGADSLLARLEADAELYVPDRLRGSPLLAFTAVLGALEVDGNKIAGVVHELFGEPAASGLRALNPGLARGQLLEHGAGSHDPSSLRSDGIYLLPETTSELPRVAGILTENEGSSLSHVQLLARNLGIPNVVVEGSKLALLRRHVGTRVSMAVSPGGIVRIDSDGPQFDSWFGDSEALDEVRIVPDLEKLDLEAKDPISLSDLRASDSGRRSGPKGANLGELAAHFPDAVPPGFVVPFGAFRALLEQPLEPGASGTTFAWMREQYAAIAQAPAEAQDSLVRAFLEELREWIGRAPLPADLETSVVSALRREFGEEQTYGVFVRSDTNVEDLPGFTGAGLNLTVPNVIGEKEVLQALRDVWASPFTERAYRWRQSLMDQPEFVFPAVVVQRAFDSEISGVMVTADVESGDRRWLSVAANEGVGGAVDGQAAEQVRVPRQGGRVRLLSQATAFTRASLNPSGGVRKGPAVGADTLLGGEELEVLVAMADRIDRFPALRRDGGDPLAADVEFAFRDGKLALLQVRPFVESKKARKNEALRSLDASLSETENRWVSLDEEPLR